MDMDDQGQIQFMVGSNRPYTLLMRNVATKETLLSTIASLKHSRKQFAPSGDIKDATIIQRLIEHEITSGDWDIVDGYRLCVITLDDWGHFVKPGGLYCLLRSDDGDMEASVSFWARRLLLAGQQLDGSLAASERSTVSPNSSISAIMERKKEHHTTMPRSTQQNWRSSPNSRVPSSTSSSRTSGSILNVNMMAPTSPDASPNPDVIIITACRELELPCAYPPSQEKMNKCSFAPSTPLWKALRTLSHESNVNIQKVHWLKVRGDSNVGKRLEFGERITASKDTTLGQMHLKSGGGEGMQGYLLYIMT